VVKIFAFLGLEQNWTFFKGLYDRMGEIFCIKLEADITKNPIFRSGAK